MFRRMRAVVGQVAKQVGKTEATDSHRSVTVVGFDGDYYLRRYSDVARAEMDPLDHYVRYGKREGRLINARAAAEASLATGFDAQFYLRRYPDVARANKDPLDHYIRYGRQEGRFIDERSAELGVILQSGLFDANYYLVKNADVAMTGVDPFDHYVEKGWREGRNPSKNFDGLYYTNRYADVRNASINPLFHFILIGKPAGRFPNRDEEDIATISKSQLFDGNYYLSQVPGFVKGQGSLIEHFVKIGAFCGMNPNGEFDLSCYNELVRQAESTDGCNGFAHSIRASVASNQAPSTASGRRTVVYADSHATSGSKRIAVFAMYDSEGHIHRYIVDYLTALSATVDTIVVVGDNDLAPREFEKIRHLVTVGLFRRHGEYDFGSYKRGVEWLSSHGFLEGAEELTLCNDSCFGPVTSFENVYRPMRERSVDFWGITASEGNSWTGRIAYHLQTYFLVFNQRVIASGRIQEFLHKVKKEDRVGLVVLNYEVPFTEFLTQSGFSQASFIPGDAELPPPRNNEDAGPFEATHFPATLLRKYKNEFVKVKAIAKRSANEENVFELYQLLSQVNKSFLVSILERVCRTRIVDANHYYAMNSGVVNRPRFSVIMPTYNRANSIVSAVGSLINQKYAGVELIIIDDGSTDATEAVVHAEFSREIESGDLRYIKVEKSGVSACRNRGLKCARFEWIAYLDSDNLMLPGFLDCFAHNIANFPSSSVFYANMIRSSDLKSIGQEIEFHRLQFTNAVDLGTVVHKKNLVEDGGFDESLKRLVDWELFLRLFDGVRHKYINEVVMLYNDEDSDGRISQNESYEAAYEGIVELHPGSESTVTTIIPVYNHEKFLRQTIDSVISQRGHFSHTVVISDDGSTDCSREIIRDYASRYPDTIVDISSEVNVGLSENFRRCIAHCETDYLAVCEGDDRWTNDKKLHEQVALLRRNPDLSMVFNSVKVETAATGKQRTLKRQQKLRGRLSGWDFAAHKSLNLIANFSSCLFKTVHLKNMPEFLYEKRLSEISVAFYMDSLGPIGFISRPMSVYVQHSAGLWSGASKKEQLLSGLETRRTVRKVARAEYGALLSKIIREKFEMPLKELELSE